MAEIKVGDTVGFFSRKKQFLCAAKVTSVHGDDTFTVDGQPEIEESGLALIIPEGIDVPYHQLSPEKISAWEEMHRNG